MNVSTRSRGWRELALLAAGVFLLAPAGKAADETPRDLPRQRHEWNADLRRDESGKLLSANRRRAIREASRVPVDPSMRAPGTGLRALEAPLVSWQPLGP